MNCRLPSLIRRVSVRFLVDMIYLSVVVHQLITGGTTLHIDGLLLGND